MSDMTHQWRCPNCDLELTITVTHIIYACTCTDQRFHLHERCFSDAQHVILGHRQECA